MGLEEIVWLRPQKIIEISKERTLTSEELLVLKSSSFFLPIKLLTIAKGDDEEYKEPYVRVAYNIFRELDECEDVPIKSNGEKKQREIINERLGMITRFSYIVGEVVKRDYSIERRIEDIIQGDDLRSVTKWLTENEPKEDGKVFAEHFGRGIVLRELYEIGKEGEIGKDIKKALDYSLKSMADGMSFFIDKGPIETYRQLDNYCEYVAGKVGKTFLNELVKLKDLERLKLKDKSGNLITTLDDKLAELFAKFLQLTNMAKNVRPDYEEGRKFFPGEWIHKGISYESMMDGLTIGAQQVRNEVLYKILSTTSAKFYPSLDYVKSIPKELSGYRAFCLFPLILAEKTIENMRSAGPERVFKGDEDAIKIPYGIDAIKDFTYNIVKFEKGEHLDNWLEKYKENPAKFSFKPGDYKDWAPQWLTTNQLKNE